MAPIPKVKCKWCGRVASENLLKPRSMVFGKEWVYLDCGHTLIRDAVRVEGFEEMISKDGRTPFPFQVETAQFAEKANLNFICAHEMGLGKMVINCLLTKRHLEEVKPILFVCKAGLKMQGWAEYFRWTGEQASIIESSRDKPDFDFFDIFIVSFDTLRLVRPTEKVKGDDGVERDPVCKWDDAICSRFRWIVIDETQQIKNPASARTKSLKSIIAATGFDLEGKPQPRARIAGYSGTPIKNRPSEYQTLLGMVRPEMFGNHDAFVRTHVRFSPVTGKEVGLRNPEYFHSLTKDFIIRYERSEVLPDLPKIFRQFQLADMEGNFVEVYKRTVKEFQEFMDLQERSPNSATLIGWFSRMRHITGVAKVNRAVEFTEEFLLSNNRKLVIFLHHKETATALVAKLSKLMKEGDWEPPLNLHSGLDMRARHELVEEFKDPKNRIMIASQLAAGEGLNLQFCSDCLMMERQWNPANEEQCEARFPRPGSTAEIVNVWYLIAAGTIDEFLTDLVEQKRGIVKQVMSGGDIPDDWNEGNLMQELADVMRKKGLRSFMKGKK